MLPGCEDVGGSLAGNDWATDSSIIRSSSVSVRPGDGKRSLDAAPRSEAEAVVELSGPWFMVAP
jgi:hypothetical protein